ncbi:MAG: hypothetical protein H0T53_13330 [Herpetosiphonaceae bacterium]|nr:hypothetical protein [Herpetosiphonaceae bacterium]
MYKLVRTLLALAMVTALLVFPGSRSTYAAGESGSVTGSGTAACMLPGSDFNGMMVDSARQGEVIDLSIAGFANPDVVSIWLTFPDGRVFDVISAYFLDGLFDFVEDNETKFLVEGEGSLGYELTEKFPVGCHRITVESVFTGNQVIIPFVLMPGGEAASGPATLKAVPAAAKQNTSISLEARGFMDGEDVALWLTQPDGTVVDLGQAAAAGSDFDLVDFFVPSLLPVGKHSITAKGLKSGYTAITPFELMAGLDDAPTGDATLDVLFERDLQRSVFLLVGTGFGGSEDVSFWLTYPNGKVLYLGDGKTDASGLFDLFIYVDEQFPTGKHYVSVRGNKSGRVATGFFYLDSGNGLDAAKLAQSKGQVQYE